MDTQTLILNLRELTISDYEWTFSLYTAKKSRDGVELNVSQCAMQDIAGLVDATVIALLEKVLLERTVADYTPFLPKEAIGAFEQSHELVRDSIQDIVSNTQNTLPYAAEDFVSGVLSTPTGYLFSGCRKDENGDIIDRVLLMKRSNPFIKAGKARLCIAAGGKVVTGEQPMLKFTYTADLLLIGGICYILTPSIEKDLGLENRQIAICTKRMGVIAENNLINNYEELEKAAYLGKNIRKFLDFDKEILDHIVRLPILERADFLSEYGITIDEQGLVDTDDAEQCDLLIDLLCCRSCHDALGRLSVGSNIMPR